MIRRLYETDHPVKQRRAILFAAVSSGGSAMGVSAAVAETLATQTSASVCLVEADLRSPAASRSADEHDGLGLSELLLEDRPLRAAIRSVTSSLSVLPAGVRRADAQHRLTIDRLKPYVRELRAMFDYLVVSTAPAAGHQDAALLASLVDGLVLTVAAGRTRREAARRTVAHLQQSGVHVLGAVLVDRAYPIPEALYGKL